jgi:hypothetical protein
VERARQRRGALAVRAAVPSDRGNYGIARPGAIHGARAVDAGGFRGLRLLGREKRGALRHRRGGGSEEDRLLEIDVIAFLLIPFLYPESPLHSKRHSRVGRYSAVGK